MDRNELKNNLQHVFDNLKALEERARKLKNQNLADIAASAHGKVKQLVDHPDLELVADTHRDPSVNPDGSPAFDPKAPTSRDEAIRRMSDSHDPNPEGAARERWPHLFELPAPREPINPQPVQGH